MENVCTVSPKASVLSFGSKTSIAVQKAGQETNPHSRVSSQVFLYSTDQGPSCLNSRSNESLCNPLSSPTSFPVPFMKTYQLSHPEALSPKGRFKLSFIFTPHTYTTYKHTHTQRTPSLKRCLQSSLYKHNKEYHRSVALGRRQLFRSRELVIVFKHA